MAVDVGEHVRLILSSKKNANLLVDLLNRFETGVKGYKEMKELCAGLSDVFTKYLNERTWHGHYEKKSTPAKGRDTKINSAKDVFVEWAHEKYNCYISMLLKKIQTADLKVKCCCIDAVLRLLKTEQKAYASGENSTPNGSFPAVHYSRLIDVLVLSKQDLSETVKYFADRYTGFGDLKYYALKNIDRAIAKFWKKSIHSHTAAVATNTFVLLKHISIPSGDDKPMQSYCIWEQDKVFSCKDIRAVYGQAFLSFLRLDLPVPIHRKILLRLDTDVMPHLSDPKVLIDFLTESYNVGGVTSLLALNGLFTLISSYNLEYPDFYQKLYSLLQTNVLYVKYRSRFFYLLDIFLTSTHLPGYLVAAFAKKLARLCLSAPTDALLVILPLILNILRRHPNCKTLIHRQPVQELLVDESQQIQEDPTPMQSHDVCNLDPFVMNEADPAKCRALESSLWELETLKHHFYPDVASIVEKFSKPIERAEEDLADCLELTIDDIFDKEIQGVDEDTDIPMNYAEPSAVMSGCTDLFSV